VGTGDPGDEGDGGLAVNATLGGVAYIALNPGGTILYLSDEGNARVRQVDLTTGIITNFAGREVGPGGFGYGGPAVDALLLVPGAVAADSLGNVYIADEAECNVLVVNSLGIISVFAGNGQCLNDVTDGEPATAASLLAPVQVAVDASDNAFIGVPNTGTIYAVDAATQTIRRVAGGGTSSSLGGAPTDFNFVGRGLFSLSELPDGTLAIGTSSQIFRLDLSANSLSLVAGNGILNFSPDGTLVTAAALDGIGGVAYVDGKLVFTDYTTSRIQEFLFSLAPSCTLSSTSRLGTVAGDGAQGFSGDGAAALAAALSSPQGLAAASDGTVYFADSANHRIRAVKPDGTIKTIAGSGEAGDTGDGGPAIDAGIGQVIGVALDPSETKLYFADVESDVVRRIDLVTGIISRFAGDPNALFPFPQVGDGGLATAASLAFPTNVAVGPNGDVYIADSANCSVRVVGSNGIIETLAGDATCSSMSFTEGGSPRSAGFADAYWLAVDAQNNVFVLDAGGVQKIYRVDSSTNTISTIAGGGPDEMGVGLPAQMHLTGLTSMAFAANGDLLLTTGTQIFDFSISTPSMKLLAGVGSIGIAADETELTAAPLDAIGDVAQSGNAVWFSESGNNRIRSFTIAPSGCTASSTCGNGTLEAGETCDDANVTSGDGCSSICQIEPGFACVRISSPEHSPPQFSLCEPFECGDGFLADLSLQGGPAEQCDDGNVADGDGCSSTCTVEAGFTCTTIASPQPHSVCAATASCGNNVIDAGEECDDGNLVDGDGCSSTCHAEAGFTCLTVELPQPHSECTPTPAVCGNGLLEAGEACDDGNTVDGDGCSSACVVETGFVCTTVELPQPHSSCVPRGICGNGVVEAGEQCDNGALNSDALPGACRTTCVLPRCGDNVTDPGESCDDGVFNGGAGYCNTGCSAFLPRLTIADTEIPSLNTAPALLVALLPDEQAMIPDCTETAAPGPILGDVTSFLAGKDLFVGRIVEAQENMEIANPLFFVGDITGGKSSLGAPLSRPGDLSSLAFSSSADTVAADGIFTITAGSRFVVSISAAPSLPACPCVSGNTVSVNQCTTPGDPQPDPTCQGFCPQLTFRAGSATTVQDPVGLPGAIEDVGPRTGPFEMSCDRTCQFQGADPSPLPSGQCGDPAEPGGTAPPTLTDTPPFPCPITLSEPSVPEFCQHATGIPDCDACPTGAACGELGVGGTAKADECMFAGVDGSCAGSDDMDCPCVTSGVPDLVNGSFTPQQLLAFDPSLLMIYCMGHPFDSTCREQQLHDPLAPPGTPPDNSVTLGTCGSLASNAHQIQCEICSTRLGLGCVGLKPLNGVPPGLRETDHAPTVFVDATAVESDPSLNLQSVTGEQLRNIRRPLYEGETKAGNSTDPVALSTGELTIDATDISFPSRGVPFTFERSYRSGGSRSGALGPGWNTNLEERLEPVGDIENRREAPRYCVDKPGEIRCLFHLDGHGGSELFILDPTSGLFLPAPGGFGVIRVMPDDLTTLLVDGDAAPGIPVFVMTEPGGITKRFDLSGVMLSVADEKGYGLTLHWRPRSSDEASQRGSWTGATSPAGRDLDPRALSAPTVLPHHISPLNSLELDEVVDSYGRKFEMHYATYFANDPEHQPRLRLSEIDLVRPTLDGGETAPEKIVSFDFTRVDATNEAYLRSVLRTGLETSLQPATPIEIDYEYSDGVVTGNGTSKCVLAGRLQDCNPLQQAEAALSNCNENLANAPSQVINQDSSGDKCTIPRPSGSGGGGGHGSFHLDRLSSAALFDNIVRVTRNGDIELEARYETDPTNADFDRVVEEKHGSIPAPLSSPDSNGFETAMPSVLIRQASDGLNPPAGSPFRNSSWFNANVTVPPDVLSEVPEVEGQGLITGSGPGGQDLADCNLSPLAEIILFSAHQVALQRGDMNLDETPTVKRTEVSCASVAGRHASEAFGGDLIETISPDSSFGRAKLAWDMNLVCEWVDVTDRVGIDHFVGFNFAGEPLVTADPSPFGVGYAITIRRVNADGNVVDERRPDGSSVEIGYGASTTTNLNAGERAFHISDAFERSLASAVVEHAAPGLPSPGASTRTWSFAYDPAYQQLVSATTPDGVTTLSFLDYQQLPLDANVGGPFLAHLLYRTGLNASAALTGKDLDGDGFDPRENSAGAVLTYTHNVDLGGGVQADVGVRHVRDATGRVVEDHQIVAADRADEDFDFVQYQYYEDLPHAEAGSLEQGGCDFPKGPLGRTLRLRAPSSTAASDMATTFVAYDAIGGVRQSIDNDDLFTEVTTTRNGLGLVVDERSPGPLEVVSTYDGKGQLIRTVSRDTNNAAIEPRVVVNAWGLQSVSLGSCVELEAGGCDSFNDFAVTAEQASRSGQAQPLALASASYVVPLLDLDDRSVGSVDALRNVTTRQLSFAGLVATQTEPGTPARETTFAYDSMGRLTTTQVGNASNAVQTFFVYDGFGRLIQTQAEAPLNQTSFVAGRGTITTTIYDQLDRPVQTKTEGDDGKGHRRILAATITERNSLGAERFIHRLSGALRDTLPPLPTPFQDGDSFASEELRYDSALRPVLHRAEGIQATTSAAYDGLGLREVVGLHAAASVTVDPPHRLRTTTRVTVAEGDGAAPHTSQEVGESDGRGLIFRQTLTDLTDAAHRVDRVHQYLHDGLGQLESEVDAAGRAAAYQYDRAGRLIQVDELDATGHAARTTQIQNDAMGRPTLDQPDSGAPPTQIGYDGMGRVTLSASPPLGMSGTGSYVEALSYDVAGRMAQRSTSVTHGATSALRNIAYAYNPNSVRPSALSVGGVAAKSWSRDGLERPTLATDRNLVLSSDGYPSGQPRSAGEPRLM
jgi:cysteine-rich repeat protein/YD repeat-containing protein